MSGYTLADPFRGLREQVLKLDPKSIGLSESPGRSVFGFVMETGYPQAVVTLVAIADGSVSLYFSSGGGLIGLGGHESVRKAAAELLAGAPHFLPHCPAIADTPLPKLGHTRFYLLTFQGLHSAEALENDLGNNRLPLSRLFHKAHQVISLVREADEKRSS